MASRPGGMKEPQPMTDEVREMVLSIRSEIEAKAGKNFSTFNPVSYATQVVAGVNYFVKIEVGNGEFIHARIYRDLNKNLTVHSVKTGLGNENLSYF
jgi:cystatin-A/B